MARYVDKEKVIDALDQSINIFDATDRIKALKSIEVVRCKDCKCWDVPGYCVDFMTQDEDGYCKWGERREA